jgi:BASS family bile acid:Na+ symporter
VNGSAHKLRQVCLAASAVSLLVVVTGLALSREAAWQPAAAIAALTLAVGIGAIPALRGYQFTLWIVAAVVSAMLFPGMFLRWGAVDLRNKYLLLVIVQLVMFGMGTQMSVRDFAGVARMPRGVIVGIVSQFTIMPLVGFALTKLFTFPPEIAAGIVLIGSCSSGLASNVMTYLARANLALSVTLTTFATLLAPVMTPLWMKVLAGAYVHVNFVNMMMEIVKIVLVPVGAALLHDYLKFASPAGRRTVLGIGAVGAAYIALLVPARAALALSGAADAAMTVTAFLLGAVVVAIVYHQLTRYVAGLHRVMPALSMAGIIYFTAVTTAAGRNDLLVVGGLLFVAAALHNGFGYLLGYLMARATGLSRTDARTVAIEVGLQNGGMAAGVAASLGKLGTLGLAAAIFSPWMNISGSILANYWRKRQPPMPASPNAEAEATEETPRGFEPVRAETVIRTS